MSLEIRTGLPRKCAALAAGAVWITLASHAAAAIPFQSASVHERAGKFVLTWRAPRVKRVRVYTSRNVPSATTAVPVAVGGPVGRLILSLRPAARWYFELVPNIGQPLTIAPRSLHISAVNARDVGGYRTRSGAWVRMGRAFRTNALYHLSPHSIAVFEALHLRTIVDLRTARERRLRPDAVIPGSAVVHANVLADDRKEMRAWFKPHASPMRHKRFEALLASITAIYRDFVRLPSARRAYHKLFVRLATPADLPLVFHCTGGKDRTGWGQAVLLTILGVPRPVIERDYELSDYYLMQRGNALAKALPIGLTASQARQLAEANPADLNAAFTEVHRLYGSFANYLHRGLALNDATLAAIRRNFLVR